MKIEESWLQLNSLYKCPVCGIEKSKKGIGTHIWRVHGNGKNFETVSWNKGLRYSYEDISGKEKADIRKAKISKSKLGNSGKASTIEKEKERCRKLSKALKGKTGGFRVGSGRGKGCWYESPIAGRVYLHSTYELEYAKHLDKEKINWERNKKYFVYSFQDKNHKYFPDFYLIETKGYIEIKGFKTDKDEAKWAQFSLPLTILYGKDLIDLGLVVKLH